MALSNSVPNDQLQEMEFMKGVPRMSYLTEEEEEEILTSKHGVPRAASLSMENSPVHINVGGELYTSSLETLTRYPNSKLSKLFNGEIPIVLDTIKHHYFIDRDGKLFRYVLNFMRTERVMLSADFDEYESLLDEAKFFQLESMIKQIEDMMSQRLGPPASTRDDSLKRPSVYKDSSSQPSTTVTSQLESKRTDSQTQDIEKSDYATRSKNQNKSVSSPSQQIKMIIVNSNSETGQLEISADSRTLNTIFPELGDLSQKTSSFSQVSRSVDMEEETSSRAQNQEDSSYKEPNFSKSPARDQSNNFGDVEMSGHKQDKPFSSFYVTRYDLSQALPKMQLVELIERLYNNNFNLKTLNRLRKDQEDPDRADQSSQFDVEYVFTAPYVIRPF